jgi:acetyltransferase-like isoleucine patch superfamily enzyme
MVNFDSTTPAQADITLEVNGQVASTFGFPNATLLNSPYFKRSEHPEMENSLIIELVHIAEGCRVVNSMVGPNVSIGEHAVIEDSIIKPSFRTSRNENGFYGA